MCLLVVSASHPCLLIALKRVASPGVEFEMITFSSLPFSFNNSLKDIAYGSFLVHLICLLSEMVALCFCLGPVAFVSFTWSYLAVALGCTTQRMTDVKVSEMYCVLSVVVCRVCLRPHSPQPFTKFLQVFLVPAYSACTL